MPTRDSLIRATDELIEDGRLDDYLRSFLYSVTDATDGLSYGPMDLAIDVGGYKQAIVDRAAEMDEQAKADARAEHDEDRDEHERGFIA